VGITFTLLVAVIHDDVDEGQAGWRAVAAQREKYQIPNVSQYRLLTIEATIQV
jgi:hypothetical protein